jgi:hypothetical protein
MLYVVDNEVCLHGKPVSFFQGGGHLRGLGVRLLGLRHARLRHGRAQRVQLLRRQVRNELIRENHIKRGGKSFLFF